MFVPIILGSDKTTVSVATGHTEFWPIYLSVGNIRNNARRAQKNGVVLLGFLGIPKSQLILLLKSEYQYLHFLAEKRHRDDNHYRKFRRQLFHTSVSKILSSLKPGMVDPEVVRCPDGHFRRAIFGLGPYIADYPEQALIGNIVQGWCPKYVLLCLHLTK